MSGFVHLDRDIERALKRSHALERIYRWAVIEARIDGPAAGSYVGSFRRLADLADVDESDVRRGLVKLASRGFVRVSQQCPQSCPQRYPHGCPHGYPRITALDSSGCVVVAARDPARLPARHPAVLPAMDPAHSEIGRASESESDPEGATPLSVAAPEPAASAVKVPRKRSADEQIAKAEEMAGRRVALLVAFDARGSGLGDLARDLVAVGGKGKRAGLSDLAVVTLLGKIDRDATAESLTPPALVFGFEAALRAEAPAANYVLKAARGYDPTRAVPSRNGHAREPIPETYFVKEAKP